MIDKPVFESLLGELSTYYKRSLTPFVQGVWYSYLSDRLTTEQFTQCVEQWLLSAKSMPTPEQLVEALDIEPSDKSAERENPSLIEWDVCFEAAPRPARKAGLSGLSPQGHFALRFVGGLEKLGAASEDELLAIRRQFLSAWEVMRADVSALPRLEGYTPATSDQNIHLQMACVADRQSLLSAKMPLNGNGRGLP